MSTTAGARQMPQSPGGQAQPMPPGARREQAGGLSLPAATALVIGSIIGTGVFTLPAGSPSRRTSPTKRRRKPRRQPGHPPAVQTGTRPRRPASRLPSRREALKRQVMT